MDTNGNVLSDILGNGNTVQKLKAPQLQYQQAVEDNIRKSVQTMLDKVFGAGKTIVRVSAVLDLDQKKITSQTSTEGAVTSRNQTSEKSTNTTSDGGVPGTQSNVPGYNSDNQKKSISSSENQVL